MLERLADLYIREWKFGEKSAARAESKETSHELESVTTCVCTVALVSSLRSSGKPFSICTACVL